MSYKITLVQIQPEYNTTDVQNYCDSLQIATTTEDIQTQQTNMFTMLQDKHYITLETQDISSFSKNNTINYIQTIIYQTTGIIPEHQCLVTEINSDTESQYIATPTKETTLLHTIYNQKINQDISTQLTQLHFPTIDNVDEMSYEDFIQHPTLLAHAKEYTQNVIMTHSYIHKTTQQPLFLTHNILQYLDINYTEYTTKCDDNYELVSLSNTILYNMCNNEGSMNNNEIYVYDLKNIYEYCIHKKIFDEDTTSDSYTNFIYGFVIKYFPFVELDNVLQEFTSRYSHIDTILTEHKYNKTFLHPYTQHVSEIKQSTLLLNTIALIYNIHPPYNIDLKSLFNSIQLSKYIPFVSFNDAITKKRNKIIYNKVYKIFRPSITEEQDNYYIDQKILGLKTKKKSVCSIDIDENTKNGWIGKKVTGLLYKIVISGVTDDEKIIYGDLYIEESGEIVLNVHLEQKQAVSLDSIDLIRNILDTFLKQHLETNAFFFEKIKFQDVQSNMLYVHPSLPYNLHTSFIYSMKNMYTVQLHDTVILQKEKLETIIEKYLFTIFNKSYNTIFVKNQEVVYINEDSKEIHEGEIIDFKQGPSEPNQQFPTFLYSIKDIHKDVIHKDIPYYNIKNDTPRGSYQLKYYDNWVPFYYKQISNYNLQDIQSFLEYNIRVYGDNIEKIKYNIQKYFGISYYTSGLVYKQYRDSQPLKNIIGNNIVRNIKILCNIEGYKTNKSIHEYQFYIQGAQTLYELNECKKYIDLLLTLYKIADVNGILSDYNVEDISTSLLVKKPIRIDNGNDDDDDDDDDDNDDENDDDDDDSDDDDDEIDDDYDDDDDSDDTMKSSSKKFGLVFDDDGDDEEDEEEEEEDEDEDELSDNIDSIEPIQKILDIKQTLEKSTSTKKLSFKTSSVANCLLKKLYEDTYLFPEATSDNNFNIRDQWRRTCQSRGNIRYPKIITESQKKQIDEEFPGSYDNVTRLDTNTGKVVSNTNNTITLSSSSKENFLYHRIIINNNPQNDYFIQEYDKQLHLITVKDNLLTHDQFKNKSYTIYASGIDCNEDINYDKLKKIHGSKIKCRSLMIPDKSTDTSEKKYYICPMIWDAHSEKSLRPEDLQYENETPFVSKKPKKINATAHVSQRVREEMEDNWNTDTSTNKKIKEFNPYIVGENNKKRTVLTNKNFDRVIPTLNESLLISKKFKDGFYKYPGFIDIKNGSLLPCCFQKSSKSVSNKWGNNELKLSKNPYINIATSKTKNIIIDRILQAGSFAYVSDDIMKSLGLINPFSNDTMDEDDDIQYENNIFSIRSFEPKGGKGRFISNILDFTSKNGYDMVPLLVRKGIYMSDGNCFLSLLIDLAKPSNPDKFNVWLQTWGKTYKKQLRYLQKLIIENLTEEEFKTLNKGSLDIMFRDHVSTNISSFQNFIEYLLSDSEKYYYDFWDYLTRKHKWLFPKGLKLLILEKKKDGYKIINPYFFDTQLYIQQSTPFSIILKTERDGKDYFEPLYLYYNQRNNVMSNKPSDWNINHIKVFDSEYPLLIYKQTFNSSKIGPTPDGLGINHIYNYFMDECSSSEKKLLHLNKKKLTQKVDSFTLKKLNKKQKKNFMNIQMKNILYNIYAYFEHIEYLFDQIRNVNFVSDIHTLDYYLHDSDGDVSQTYKYIVVNSYNKVVLLQQTDNSFIPIIDSPIPSLKQMNIYSSLENKTPLRVTDVLQSSLSLHTINNFNLPTLANQLSLFKQDIKLYIPITLIVDSVSSPTRIYGLITKQNNMIPVQPYDVGQNKDSINYDLYHFEDTHIMLADIGIESYTHYHLSKVFRNKQTFEELVVIIDPLEKYTIHSIFKNKKNICNSVYIQVSTLLAHKSLYLEIQDVNTDDIPVTYQTKIKLLPPDSDIIALSYKEVVYLYNDLYTASNYLIQCKPLRYMLNISNKNVTGILLENGTKVKCEEFKVYSLDTEQKFNSDFMIHKLNHQLFIHKLDFLDNMYYNDSTNIDERIKNINIIKYNDKINYIIQLSLQRFFKDVNHIFLKKYILGIIYNDEYIVEEKFILIHSIIKIIIDEILFYKFKDTIAISKEKVESIDIFILDKCYSIAYNKDQKDTNCKTSNCSLQAVNIPSENRVQDNLYIKERIRSDINENISVSSEHITLQELEDNYGNKIDTLVSHIQKLYQLIHINCKQPIYEIKENYYKNLIYKFTYSIINNFVIQSNILEGKELIKNDMRYITNENEVFFRKEHITSNNIGMLYNKTMEYNYIREKNIIDYFISWNNNTYIDIHSSKVRPVLSKESTYTVTPVTTTGSILILDIQNISFLTNTMINDKTKTNDDTYIVTEIADDEVRLL